MGEIKPIKAYKASSKRIKLHSMSEVEMRELIDRTNDLDKQTDYIERFNKALSDRKKCIFYLPWKIEDKKTGEEIGWFMYDGPVSDNTIAAYVEINENKRKQGYAFETLKTMASYAEMADAECYVVEGDVDDDNEDAVKLVKNVGFIELQAQDCVTRYGFFRRFVPSATTWMSIGMLLGLSVGRTMGTGAGMVLGMAFGYLFGMSIDKSNRAKYVETVNTVRAKYGMALITDEDVKNSSNPFKKANRTDSAQEDSEKACAENEAGQGANGVETENNRAELNDESDSDNNE